MTDDATTRNDLLELLDSLETWSRACQVYSTDDREARLRQARDEVVAFYFAGRVAAAAQPAPVATCPTWRRVEEEQPEPHARYVVRRGEITFTAAPCYGMHDPWWVPGGHLETDPIVMADDDLWCPDPLHMTPIVPARDGEKPAALGRK